MDKKELVAEINRLIDREELVVLDRLSGELLPSRALAGAEIADGTIIVKVNLEPPTTAGKAMDLPLDSLARVRKSLTARLYVVNKEIVHKCERALELARRLPGTEAQVRELEATLADMEEFNREMEKQLTNLGIEH